MRYESLLMCVLIASGGSVSAERATYSITWKKVQALLSGGPKSAVRISVAEQEILLQPT